MIQAATTPTPDVATVDLRTCVSAVTNASYVVTHHKTNSRPELIGDKSTDYSIYTLDATEGIEGDLFEGQGLLSWNLARPTNPTKAVSGMLKPSLSGQVIEVRMKLSQVTSTTQADFVQSIQTYERIARTLPATFDNANWSEFMRHASAVIAPSQSKIKPLVRKPTAPINTLQKARELAARQTPQGMSAQLLAARQQQATSQMHAQRIAQQAAAQTVPVQKGNQDSDGPMPDDSPQLPTPSSPPQMRTFVHPPARSNSMPAADTFALPPLAKFNTTGDEARGVKRKAGDMVSDSVVPTFSPSKATNAARNKFGEVQQLFKSAELNDKPTVMDKLQKLRESNMARTTAKISPPTQQPLQKNDVELLAALKEGKPIKYCYNCGTISTKGNWRALIVGETKQNLCNACGVYYKNKKMMRPPNLWKPLGPQSKTFQAFPAHSNSLQTKQAEEMTQPLTSPASGNDVFRQRARAIQSSPAPATKRGARPFPTALPKSSQNAKDERPFTPEKNEVLHEIHLNTPPGPISPSPASGGPLEDLVALLQTPKKTFSSKMLSSPSPWRSMFTSFPEESPGKHKIDKFLEELGISGAAFDLNAFQLSPTTENMASFMSSPPSLGLFTSSAGEENLTPEDQVAPQQAGCTPEHLLDGDSLFTPRKPTTRSDTNSAQRNLRSAGKRFGESMFGQAL